MKYVKLCFICFFLLNVAHAQTTAKKGTVSKKISADLFGIFFEDINYAADGGLYAELIQNRSFEYSPTDRRDWNPFTSWEYVTPGYSYGSVSIETSEPVHPNNPHYLLLNTEHTGDSGTGIKNTGFAGIALKAGEKYNLSFFARTVSNHPIQLSVFLADQNGKALCEQKIKVNTTAWTKYAASLTAAANCDNGSLVILAIDTGKLALDVVSLFPEHTFKDRPNGLRADLAATIADLHPKFIRFPGGCLAHGDGLGNMIRYPHVPAPPQTPAARKAGAAPGCESYPAAG
jgi:hypothetical protein